MKYHVYIQRGMFGAGVQVSPKPYHRLETARAAMRFWQNQERRARAHFSTPSGRAIGGCYVVREDERGRRTPVGHWDLS